MKKVYILVARGAMQFFNNTHQIISKDAFSTPELAEAAKSKFFENCTVDNTGKDLKILDPKSAKVYMLDLDLIEK